MQRRSSLPAVYFMLAIFDVVAICASLALTNRLVGDYGTAIATNRRWARTLRDLTTLTRLAGAVNGPGNDVFDSHDIDGETRRLEEALRAFTTEVGRIRTSPTPAVDTMVETMHTGLAAVEDDVAAMANETARVFASLRDRRPIDAGLHMAAMDRRYGRITARLGTLISRVHEMQDSNLDLQQQAARRIEHLEWLIGLLIVGMVCGIGTYGARLARAFTIAASEREQQASALERARDEAIAATRAKDAFLAAVSHEFRTPMQGIIGMTDLLLGSTLSDEQREHTLLARGSAERLLAMLEDVLDFTQIESGHLTLALADVSPSDLVEEVVGLLAPVAAANDTRLHCLVPSESIVIPADRHRLLQVLLNLMANAIKYTHHGDVTLRWDRDGTHGSLRFAIEDTGIGIDARDHDRLFEPFVRGVAARGVTPRGSGLGLTIAKRLVDAMGGTIGFSSHAGSGTHFWFTVPVASTVNGMQESSRQPASAGPVLWIDASPVGRAVARAQLASWGFSIDTVADVQAARLDGTFHAIVLVGTDDETVRRSREALAQRNPRTGRPLIVLAPPIRPSRLRPLIDAPPLPTPATPTPTHHPRLHGRVLVAEDESTIQKAVRKRLTDIGCIVDVVVDGEAAVQAAQEASYDLILLDVQLCGMSGLDAAQRIRAARPDGNARPPIVAMTAHASASDLQRCRDVGMNDCLVKPFTLDALTAMVERWLPTPG